MSRKGIASSMAAAVVATLLNLHGGVLCVQPATAQRVPPPPTHSSAARPDKAAAEISELVGIVASGGGSTSMLDMLSAIDAEMTLTSTLSALGAAYEANPALLGGLSPLSAEGAATLYKSLDIPDLAGVAGAFFRPVPGIVTSPFGYRPRFRRMHKGIDLRLAVGDTVRAAFAGLVKATGFDRNGYGYYIILSHPSGIETLYGHLSGFIASVGQSVRPGAPIALGGSTGRSTGPHLHFETRYRGLAIDPARICPSFTGPAGANQVSPDRVLATLRAAEFLLPAVTSEKSQLKVPVKASYGMPSTYKVKRGDNVFTIARKFAMPPEQICRLNGLSSPLAFLISGQILKLK